MTFIQRRNNVVCPVVYVFYGTFLDTMVSKGFKGLKGM